MNSHELAKHLLAQPDMPVAFHVLGSTYSSGNDIASHGPVKIGVLCTYGGDHIVMGNISKRQINPPNWYISKMLVGEAPERWGVE